MELMSVGFEEECVAATEAAEAASRSAVPSTPSPGELSWAVSPVLSPGGRTVAKPEAEPELEPQPEPEPEPELVFAELKLKKENSTYSAPNMNPVKFAGLELGKECDFNLRLNSYRESIDTLVCALEDEIRKADHIDFIVRAAVRYKVKATICLGEWLELLPSRHKINLRAHYTSLACYAQKAAHHKNVHIHVSCIHTFVRCEDLQEAHSSILLRLHDFMQAGTKRTLMKRLDQLVRGNLPTVWESLTQEYTWLAAQQRHQLLQDALLAVDNTDKIFDIIDAFHDLANEHAQGYTHSSMQICIYVSYFWDVKHETDVFINEVGTATHPLVKHNLANIAWIGDYKTRYYMALWVQHVNAAAIIHALQRQRCFRAWHQWKQRSRVRHHCAVEIQCRWRAKTCRKQLYDQCARKLLMLLERDSSFSRRSCSELLMDRLNQLDEHDTEQLLSPLWNTIW